MEKKELNVLYEVRPSKGIGKLWSMKLLYFVLGMLSLLFLGHYDKLNMISATSVVILTISFGIAQAGQDIAHAIANAIAATKLN